MSVSDRCETVPHKRRGPLRPDFNPTKNMWKELNSRLAETAPVHFEKLPEFQVRVKNVVNWLSPRKPARSNRRLGSAPSPQPKPPASPSWPCPKLGLRGRAKNHAIKP